MSVASVIVGDLVAGDAVELGREGDVSPFEPADAFQGLEEDGGSHFLGNLDTGGPSQRVVEYLGVILIVEFAKRVDVLLGSLHQDSLLLQIHVL